MTRLKRSSPLTLRRKGLRCCRMRQVRQSFIIFCTLHQDKNKLCFYQKNSATFTSKPNYVFRILRTPPWTSTSLFGRDRWIVRVHGAIHELSEIAWWLWSDVLCARIAGTDSATCKNGFISEIERENYRRSRTSRHCTYSYKFWKHISVLYG